MNENVETAEIAFDMMPYSPYVIVLIEVANDRVYGGRQRTKLLAQRFKRRRRPAYNAQAGTDRSEMPSDGAADAAAGSGDEDPLSLE